MERSRFLDILRGFAILGILPVNMPFFAMAVVLIDDYSVAGSAVNRLTMHVINALFTFKFFSLFSLMFGVGIAVLYQRCQMTGRRFGRLMAMRLIMLLAVGTAHVVFLWYGDILFVYALLGLVLFALVRCSPRVLSWLGGVVIFGQLPLLAALGILFALNVEQPGPDRSPEGDRAASAAATGSMDDYMDNVFGFHPAFETAVYRGSSYLRQQILRLATWSGYMFVAIPLMMPRIAGMFLIGMACARAGWFLKPREHRPCFVRLAWWGLSIGVPLQLLAQGVQAADAGEVVAVLVPGHAWAAWQVKGLVDVLLMVLNLAASIGLVAGYVGLVGLICARARLPRWTGPLEAVGRLALTNYIGQSLCCTMLFYGWGFGLFGTIGAAGLLAITIAVWALELTLSPLYLRYFDQGPLERAWRWATYLGMAPLPKLESSQSTVRMDDNNR